MFAGQSLGWKMPKSSALLGEQRKKADDWCEEHRVPESICVECNPDLLPPPPHTGWNKEFGVHDCPYYNPGVIQTPGPVSISPVEIDRSRRALAFAPRAPNGRTCRMQDHRIQLASQEIVNRLGITLQPVTTAAVVEGVTAPGVIEYDPTHVARLSARVPGIVRRVEKQVGDRVNEGELLALVDAAEVGKAKADFQQALTLVELRTQTLALKKSLEATTVTGQEVREAEAALEEAQLQRLLAEQTLANLGLPIRAADVKRLSPAELATHMRYLGIPHTLQDELAKETTSANLLPVRAPFKGEVVALLTTPGQTADPAKPLFVIADTRRVWLTLRVRYEDAQRVKAGQLIRFQTSDQTHTAEGTVAWVSPAADEKTRTVPVRVELPNPDGHLRAHAFGSSFITLRTEEKAVVVPSDAVHWEGCCNIVFVADRNFDKPNGYKVFHVRKVRPGAKEVVAGVSVTEVIVGLVPGERVAVTNSGILRAELLRNNLGAG
jgi:cobalt-zinc-cadmium efflux system membrane fusion protein